MFIGPTNYPSMFRRVLSSRMLRRVVWQKYTDVSGNSVAFVIRVDDNGDGRIFWSVCTIYHTTRCHIPDDSSLHSRHCESLKSHCISIIYILFISASIIPIISDNYFHVLLYIVRGKGKAVPLQAWTGPEGSRFQDNQHMKVVRLSALRTGCLYPQETCLVLISVRG